MKILLTAINAKYIHSNPAVFSLKASAGAAGEAVKVKEFTINQQHAEVLSDIYEEHADVVCFSCYIWNISFINGLIAEMSIIMPNVHIWLGGPEVSFDCESYLKEHSFVKGIMKHEGEKTFRTLCEYYAAGNEAYDRIPGLCFRKDDKLVDTGNVDLIDMDELPFLYNDLSSFQNRIIYYEASRGCPFSCAYCLSSIEKTMRFRSLEKVFAELLFFIDNKVPQVKFIDRTFNIDHKRTIAIWEFIKSHDKGITNYHFEIAADILTAEEIALVNSMRPGLIQLEIGVQSTNEKTLEAVSRKNDIKKIRENISALRAVRNKHLHLDLIAGLPYEDMESFSHSFDDVYSMEPEELQLGFLKLLKGSPLRAEAGRYGIIAGPNPPYEVLKTDFISYEDICLLKAVEEMVEVYYNSRQFETSIKYLAEGCGSAFAFYKDMAMFYHEQGYDKASHSRWARYDILKEFGESIKRGGEELEKALLHDMYLREKLKKRPEWAPDLKEEGVLRILYSKYKKAGMNIHIEPAGDEYIIYDYGRRDPVSRNCICMKAAKEETDV